MIVENTYEALEDLYAGTGLVEDLLPADVFWPLFQGQRPQASRLSVTGKTVSLHRAYRMGEPVLLLVQAHVDQIGHEQDDKLGLVRTQRARLDTIIEVTRAVAGEPPADFLKRARDLQALLRDRVMGPGEPPTGSLFEPPDPED